MRNILAFMLAAFVLSGCNSSQVKDTQSKERGDLVPEPDRHYRLLDEAIQKIRKMDCSFADPDTSLSGIILGNSSSADKIIGTGNKSNEDGKYYFYSKLDRETLTLTQHPGSGQNQISIFSVSFSDKADHGYKQLNIDTFNTGKGIKLGLEKQQVIEKLGTCYTVVDSTKDCIELYYRIESPKDSRTKVLATNNMPVYCATYTFCKNKLGYYEFGFEYP